MKPFRIHNHVRHDLIVKSACLWLDNNSYYIQEDPGVCARVPQQVNQPFGEDAATSILCEPFRQGGPKSIAVVGNGPLSARDRMDIESHSLIIRSDCIKV